MAEPTIEDYFIEDRTFPPPAEFVADALVSDRLALRRGRGRLRGVLGPPGPRAASPGSTTSTPRSSGTCPSPSGSSAARSTSRTTASTATSRPGAATGSPTTGRASRATPAPSPTPTCSTRCCRFANVLKASASQRGRPGRDLHADDPRAAGRHAGLHPHRRRPLGDLRRLLPRLDHRPRQRRRGQGHHHRRRRLPAGRGRAAEAQRRRRGRPAHRRSSTSSWSGARENDVDDGRGPRPLVPRAHGRGRRPTARPSPWTPRTCSTCSTPRAPRPSPRASCTRPAATSPRSLHPQVRLRPAARARRLLVRRRHRLGHRPQLHRLRPAHQRRDVGDLRGHARHARARSPVGDRREVRRHAALHRAHRHPHLHEVGRAGAPEARPVEPARCSAPSASPSTPRRGCGTTAHRRRALPDRRHVVADRDRRPHDHAAARCHAHQAGLGHLPAAGHRRRGGRRRGPPRRAGRRLPARSPGRGRRCCAASGATPSATATPTGAGSRAATSPATAPRSTTTATSGCSAGSTT